MNTTNESTSSVDGWPLNDASPALANDAVTQKQNPKLQQDQTKNCNEKLDLLQELRKSISDKQDECEHNQSLTSCDTPSPSAESPEIPAEPVPVPVPSTDEATSSSSPKPQAALDSFALQQTELQQVQLARLEAARRRRENHDRQQELNGASNAAAGQPPAKKPIIDASKPVNQVQEKPTAPANQLSDAPPTPPVQQAPVQQAPVEQQVPEQQAPKSTPTTAEHPTPQNAVPMVQHVAPNNTNAGFHPIQTFAGYPQQNPQHPPNQYPNNYPQYFQQPMPPGQVPPYPVAQQGYPPLPHGHQMVHGQPVRQELQNDVATEDVKEFFDKEYSDEEQLRPEDAFAKTDMQFRKCLMNNLREGIIFIDAFARVTCWNQSVEVMTGMTASSMQGFELTPTKLSLSTLQGEPVHDGECPMQKAMESGTDSSHDFIIRGRSGRESKIQMSIAPVFDESQVLGAVIVIHDNSIQYDLERQVKDLHMLSVRDPLTQVANRAEFERLLNEYVRMHRATRTNCCIIVCDIDFFKQVNDTYGHHIGDQALISFSRMLQKYVRARDVVARYGGEEFVILCANCDLESAVGRAEEIRMALNKTPQQMLNGKTISASFGVSQLLDEESTTDFFIRADQALYKAKEGGRNRVVRATNDPQAGEADEGISNSRELSKVSGLTWRKIKSKLLFSEEFVSRTPQGMLVSKLKGFINEKNARILKCEADLLSMIVKCADSSRSQDFRMDIELQSSPDKQKGKSKANANDTHMRIVIFTPQRRLFRGTNDDLYQRLVLDIRQYLMINDEGSHVHLNTFAESSDR